MTFTTSEVPTFEQALRDHGLSLPPEFDVALLPSRALRGTEGAQLHRDSEAATLRKVLSSEGFATVEVIPANLSSGVRIEKASTLLLPVLVLAYQVLIDDPQRLQVFLDALVSYVADRLPRPKQQVRFQIVIQGKGPRYREVTYEGPANEIKELTRVLRELSND